MTDRVLQISAAGVNRRIKEFMMECYGDMPKHFLPIPGTNHTLISKIVCDAKAEFSEIVIHASSDNFDYFFEEFRNDSAINVRIDNECTGSIGPAASVIQADMRVYACAGDFYSNFYWKDFINFHESHDFPASILLSRSCPVPRGAVFELCGDRVQSWHRPKVTTAQDLLNVSCYIFDRDNSILELAEEYEHHREDTFFEELHKEGKLAAFVHHEKSFNINHKETYFEMEQHLLKAKRFVSHITEL